MEKDETKKKRGPVAAAIRAWVLMRCARNGLDGVTLADDAMLVKATELREMIEAVS